MNTEKGQNQKKETAHVHVHTHVDEAGHIYMHEHECEEGECEKGYEHEHVGGNAQEKCDGERRVTEKSGRMPAGEHINGESGGRHRHVHSQTEKKAVLNRLSKAIGHMEAVKRMVERDEDCGAVLIQLAAVRSAINNTGKVVLKNHINHCIMEAVEENDQGAIALLDQAIDKFM